MAEVNTKNNLLKTIISIIMIIVVLLLVIGEFLGIGTIRPSHVNAILASASAIFGVGSYAAKKLQESKTNSESNKNE